MIRVSGNVGLKMSDSEFSRQVHGYRKGAISDDVLFVGFKGKQLYLLPLEVKTGVRPDFAYAGQQALELKRYLMEEVPSPNTLAARLYRGLFIRQVLMQVDKLCLYQVMQPAQLAPLLTEREWWLKGIYPGQRARLSRRLCGRPYRKRQLLCTSLPDDRAERIAG